MKYVRNVLAAILILATLLSGGALAASSFTGYISQDTYVYKKASASSARKPIYLNTKVTVTGKSGKFYKVKNASGSGSGYVLTGCVSKKKVAVTGTSKSASASWRSKVVKLNWFGDGKKVLKTGKYGYIYDIETGITVKITRMGGSNHADVEPATAADTSKLLKIAGGTFSWDCHPVILKSGGKYVACSINTMPHGDQTITNNKYEGQFCLHMVGSITHGTETVNADHQAAIQTAYDWAH